jgi:hypothetical protein
VNYNYKLKIVPKWNLEERHVDFFSKGALSMLVIKKLINSDESTVLECL